MIETKPDEPKKGYTKLAITIGVGIAIGTLVYRFINLGYTYLKYN